MWRDLSQEKKIVLGLIAVLSPEVVGVITGIILKANWLSTLSATIAGIVILGLYISLLRSN